MVFLDIRLNSVAPYADAKIHRMDFRVVSSIGIPIQVSKEFCPFLKMGKFLILHLIKVSKEFCPL